MPNKFAAPLLAAALCTASTAGFAAIVTNDFTQYSITYEYDDATNFGASFFDNSVSGHVSFGWNIPASVAVTGSRQPPTVTDFQMPNFLVTAAPGYTFTGPIAGFLGDLGYKETGNGQTQAGIQGAVAFDSGGARNFMRLLDKNPSTATAGVYSGSASLAHPGEFDNLFFFGVLTLGARGNANNATITASPQSTFTISFLAAPVPEPESYAMLLAGLGVIGAFAVKRRPYAASAPRPDGPR